MKSFAQDLHRARVPSRQPSIYTVPILEIIDTQGNSFFSCGYCGHMVARNDPHCGTCHAFLSGVEVGHIRVLHDTGEFRRNDKGELEAIHRVVIE